MSYNSVFGGATIYPSQLTYFSFTLNTTDVVLEWTLDRNSPLYPAANIIDVNCTAPNLKVFLPAANLASTGQAILFNNVGTTTFTVVDTLGNTICAPASGKLWQVYVSDNTTAAGVWHQLEYGVGVSSATAGALAGYGLKAIATTLNTATPVVIFNSNFTVGSNDRAHLYVWEGGVGTLTLPLPATVGSDWFMLIRNQGTGNLLIDPSGSNLIDGNLTKNISPTNSCFIVCDGTQYFTIGYGQNVNFGFNYTSINLAGLSGNYTLSTAEQNKISYRFYGALAGNINIIVPPTVQQYWVNNQTSNAYTLEVKTSGGLGVVVPQGSAAILYCDGLDVINASTAALATPILVSQGGTGATTANGALINLGGQTVGISVFQSNTIGQALTALGGSTIGQSLFISPASIGTLTALNGGSGYVNGTYTNVPLTGGSGLAAYATITVTGTAVSNVTVTDPGLGYQVGDLLSCLNSYLGGVGSGFGVQVATIDALEARTVLGGTEIGQALFTSPASIGTLSAISGGSGYVDGTYTSVPLTGGTGTGALATVVVSGGTVTSIILTDPGVGYTLNNLLSASNTNLGGTGSGLSLKVTSLDAIEARTVLGGTDIGQALFTSPASIGSLTAISGGSGYGNGSYTNVPLTGGTGTGALANMTVSGGSVTAVTLVDPGIGYSLNNLLSASNTNLGGTGSGLSLQVATLDAIEARAVLDVYSTAQVNSLVNTTVADSYIAAVSFG